MSIQLVGGGHRPEEDEAVCGPFVAECVARVQAAGAGSVEVLHTLLVRSMR